MIAPDDIDLRLPRGPPGRARSRFGARAVERWRALRDRRGRDVRPRGRGRRRRARAAGHLGHEPRAWSRRSRASCPTRPTTIRTRASSARSPTWASTPGTPLADIAVDRVFIGSCTNSRIEDLRAAAEVVRGRRVAATVRAMVVPGSTQVKAQAEAEGLDRVFRDAGFEWRDAGCSMCLGMNPDILAPGERCASTSNRNFEGRQGARRAHPPDEPGDGRRGRDRPAASTTCGRCSADGAASTSSPGRSPPSTAPTSTPTRSSRSSS